MDFTVYRTDLKIAQQIMYVFFATALQTCTFLFIIGSFFKRGKDLKKAFGWVNKQISVCDIMNAIFFFLGSTRSWWIWNISQEYTKQCGYHLAYVYSIIFLLQEEEPG